MNNENNVFGTPQVNEVVDATQKKLKELQEKNEILTKELQNVLVAAPTELMSFFKSQHEKNLELNNQIMAAFTKTPVDYTAVTSMVTEHSKNNFNTQLESLNKATEKYQAIFNQYFSK